MKSIMLHPRFLVGFSSLGILSLLLSSCGSYQNSSYYENDGIYSSSRNDNRTVNRNSTNGSIYSDYFKSKQLQLQDEVFVDVDSYTTVGDSTVTVESYSNNAAWGSNPSTVTINYYDTGWGWNSWYGPGWGWGWNAGWGMGLGWGWNSWYGPGWGWNAGWGWGLGWGWNSWYGPGWGWNSWGHPGYVGYYGNNYAYNRSRRGSSAYYSGNNRGVSANRNASTYGRRTVGASDRSTTVPRSSTFSNRVNQNRNDRGSYTPSRNRTDMNTPRTTTQPRTNNTSQPRYSPSPASSGGRGGSFGGGSGGGGRSGGGGGRGGRG
ncbi:hypothetical protein [Flavobacterium sp. UBA6135]|uniref:hypothetical protein n=1 Tax=Flavobacterium sp. UBA6135 TaxID=1946553 RepID=UPI0025BE610C|nr:hypothetical protein [Flavobacterium sp. UBA6135]